MDTANNNYKYVTVSDLQELLQRVGQQRIYRKLEEGEEDAALYAERYLSAMERFVKAKEKSEREEKEE